MTVESMRLRCLGSGVLSLALGLSQMASRNVRVDSLFLDEGFGTLDSETLDTVAAVIHELGADGRTVGLITHVSELAQQIPVRFEVSKQSGSARPGNLRCRARYL